MFRGVFANRAIACVDQGVDGLAGWSVACRGVEHLQIFISFTAGVTISYSIAVVTISYSMIAEPDEALSPPPALVLLLLHLPPPLASSLLGSRSPVCPRCCCWSSSPASPRWSPSPSSGLSHPPGELAQALVLSPPGKESLIETLSKENHVAYLKCRSGS